MQPDDARGILLKIKDGPYDLDKCVDLLYTLQHKWGPLIEVVTVLKVEKPQLYALLKKIGSINFGGKVGL